MPYVLSLNFSCSLGEFTIAFSVLLILRKNFRLEHLLQIPISIAFGYFIDLTMILLSSLNPSSYLIKLVCLIFGCVILGFGVYLEVLADVAMLPGESFVRAVTSTWNTDFGMTKVAFDVTIMVSAVVLSFLFAHQLEGIREGSLIAALLVGFIARQFGSRLAFLPSLLFEKTAISSENAAN